MRRWLVFLVVGIFAALTIPQAAFPQAATNEELLKMIQQMRDQIGSQQQKLQQLEGVLQQRGSEQAVGGAVKRVLQLQPPQALLGAPAMPPTAVKPALGLFASVELGGINFWGVETPFAAQRAPGGEIARGPWATVDVTRDFTARPTIGFYLPSGAGIISASFYTLKTQESARTFNSDRLVGPGNQGPFDSEDITLATARLKLNVNQFDLQYQYPNPGN